MLGFSSNVNAEMLSEMLRVRWEQFKGKPVKAIGYRKGSPSLNHLK
jgi:hypothetical protein